MPGLHILQCILNAAFQPVCGLRIAVDFSVHLPKLHAMVCEQSGNSRVGLQGIFRGHTFVESALHVVLVLIRSSGYSVLLDPYWLEELLRGLRWSFLLIQRSDWKAMFVQSQTNQRREDFLASMQTCERSCRLHLAWI